MTWQQTWAALNETEASRWERIGRAVSWFLMEADIQTAEVICTAGALWWSLMLAWPGDLFASNAAFTSLASVFTEATWLAFSLAAGGTPLVAFYLDSVALRRAALLFQVWYYIVIAVGIAAASPISTGIGIYAVFAFGAAWGHWRLGARIPRRR